MFFLLRCAFWLGLVFIFLPPDGDPGADAGAKVVRAAHASATSGIERVASDASRLCLERTRQCLEAAALLTGSTAALDTLTVADRAPMWRRPGS